MNMLTPYEESMLPPLARRRLAHVRRVAIALLPTSDTPMWDQRVEGATRFLADNTARIIREVVEPTS